MITDEVYEYRKWVHTYWSDRVPRLLIKEIELKPQKEKTIQVETIQSSTDEEVEKIDEENEVTTSTAPSPYGETTPVDHELPEYSSNDGDNHLTDNSGDVSDDNSMEQNWREKPKRNSDHRSRDYMDKNIIMTIQNKRANHEPIQRTIHQDHKGGHNAQTHRRSGQSGRDAPPTQNRHHKTNSRDLRDEEVSLKFHQV